MSGCPGFGGLSTRPARIFDAAGFRIQHIGGGRLTVVSGDELGVERVEVYELR